jgi:hypothetical protein
VDEIEPRAQVAAVAGAEEGGGFIERRPFNRMGSDTSQRLAAQ